MNGSERLSPDLKASLIALIPRLRRFGYALTRSQDDADDLCQIALERALTKLDQWTPGTRLDAWLFRIAHNAWIDEVRARKRRGAHVEIEEGFELPGGDAREIAHARLDFAEVRRAILGLPEEQRAVLAAVAIEGMSYQEAADALSIPIGTVMSRLARARKALAVAMTQRERPNHGGGGG